MKNKVIFLCVLGTMLFGCSKKTIEVKEWAQFQDPIFKVTFNYPKDWVSVNEQSRVVVTSSSDAADKFFDHDSRKADGVQVIVASEKSDSMQDYVKYIRDFKAGKESEGYKVSEMTDVKINGLDGKQVTYSGVFDEKTKIKAIFAATLKDSSIYTVQYAAFNDLYEPYMPVFDSLFASLTLPQKIVIPKGVDAAIPLAQVEKYSDNNLQLEYPANFGPTEIPKKGKMIAGVHFAGSGGGMRNDCSIDIDIRPAEKLSVEKVVEQNKKIFNTKSQGETKVSGERAIYLNYTPAKTKNIESRVYFIVKNDKIYRIILNYYAPMKKDFLPPFEKVVASIRLK